MVWIEFLICGSLLTFFAYNLCKEGIILSDKTHMEEGIIGMLFLAIATSFPEIVVGVTSVHSLGKIGLGYGDLIGSVIVNFMILMALDYSYGKGRVLLKVSELNRTTTFFVLGVAGVIFGAVALRTLGVALPMLKWLGLEGILVICIYGVYLKIVHKSGTTGSHEEIYHASKEPFWSTWAKFAGFLIVVMFLGVWMARVGEKIVLETALSQTFTGTLILGFATSLPEIIVTFAALRAGSVDMAVGNILGSNLFDLCVIPLLDCFVEKPILGSLTRGQVTATGVALLIALIAAGSFLVKKDSKSRLNWDTGTIFAVGLIGFVILYFVK